MNLRKVIPIVALLLIVFLAGCNKKDKITGVSPEVTSTDPISEAANIAIDSKVSAIFSVAMDPSTMTTDNFSLMKEDSPVDGDVAYTGNTLTFTPAAVLVAATQYTAKISTGATDENGLALAKDYSWNFTTGGTPDITKPTVTLTDPLNNASGVLLNKLIVVTFSKAMDLTTVTSLTYTLNQGTTSVAGVVSNTSTTATFTPTGGLVYSKVYTLTVTTGAKDLSGNALAVNYTSSFTTVDAPDTALPMVNATDPLSNAINITGNKVLTLTFSEAMTASTINSTTFTLKQGSTPVLGTVAYTGLIATFTPTSLLAAGTTYTATITTGAKDLAGNALAAKTDWSFTTIPQVTLSSTPVGGGTTSGSGLFNAGSSVIVTATQNTGYTFVNWTENGTIASTSLSYTFTLNANRILVANFALNAYTFTITASNGVVVRNPDQLTYNHGSAVQLTATPNSGYSFTSWSGDATGSTNPLTVTMTANKVITANFTLISSGGATTVNLGLAGNYVIFSNTAIANPTANSVITGNIGTGPGVTSTAITGFSLILPSGGAFSTSSQVAGNVYAHDYAVPTPADVNTASNDMLTAYTDVAGRAPDFTELYAGDISGKTLVPGVYKWSNSVLVNTDVTLSGSSTDVWIFEIAGDLTIAAGGTLPLGIKVALSGGALASNVYWQVGGSTGATLGTYSTFNGIILSAKQIIMNTGAVLNGKALAQTAVSLNANTVQ